MSCWKVAGKGWRYQFKYERKRYSGAFYPTRAAAKAAEAEHKKELAQEEKTLTDTACEIVPSFRDVANEYLDYSQRRFSEKNYKGKIYIFKEFLDFAGDIPFSTIDARQLERYLATLPRNSNYNRHRKDLCALFAWAFKRGLLAINPCIYVDNMPHQIGRRRIPTQEEMAKILVAAGEYRPFFLALFGLAARLGEINRLRWEDVNFEKRQVTLWTRKGDGTPRAQVKPINEELYQELQRLWGKRSGVWVFPNPETGEPYRNRRWQIKTVCALAGVPYYSWHCIRHYVASFLADTHKESLPTIQRILGHQNITTTARYIQSLSRDVVEAAEKLQSTHQGHSQKGKKKLTVGSPNGNRTRVSAVRGRCPRPLDDGTAPPYISQGPEGVKGRSRRGPRTLKRSGF
jgi:integrase